MVLGDQSEAGRLAHELEQWVKKMKCSGTTGLSLESFPDIRIGVDPSPVQLNSQSFEMYESEELMGEKVERVGFSTTRLEGEGELILSNGDRVRGSFEKDLRHGYCEVHVKESNIKVVSIRGEYRHGKLNGKARVYFQDRSWLEGYFKQGILHGFTRIFDKKGRLKFVSNHKNGTPSGVSWRIVRGGGCVVGRVNDKGQLTGIRIAYIYPDFTTALLGSFVDGIMQSSQQVQVVSIIQDETGIKIPLFSRPSGPFHVRQLGTFDSVCSDPMVRDPYEATMVQIRASTIDGAAEGLFARKEIEPNTVLAFYNGSRARPETFDPSTWETNNYRIFDPADMPHGTIDIPTWAQDSKQYCASLAHKCNHSFLPNAEFVVFDHPKFGLIPCLLSIADIRKDEEVLVGYGYDLTDSPVWYQQAWKTSIFGRQGVAYKDWLNCTVKIPLGSSSERRG